MTKLKKKETDVLDVVDTIYLEEDYLTMGQLDSVHDDLKQWAQKKDEPPDYLISIIDKIEKQ